MPKGVYKHTHNVWNKGKKGEYRLWVNGRKFTPEWIEKIKVANQEKAKKRIGIKRPEFSEEWRRKIGIGNKGKVMSQESRDKISKGLRYGVKNKVTMGTLRRREEKAGRKRPDSCELCGADSHRICFDHDHETGLFRGWICNRCNSTLGFVEDSIEILEKMINYLKITKKLSDRNAGY